MSIRERTEFVGVSNERSRGFDFAPGVGIGTWKVYGGTARIRQDHWRRTEWPPGPPVARQPRASYQSMNRLTGGGAIAAPRPW